MDKLSNLVKGTSETIKEVITPPSSTHNVI